jgi:hypothetical protein
MLVCAQSVAKPIFISENQRQLAANNSAGSRRTAGAGLSRDFRFHRGVKPLLQRNPQQEKYPS